MFFYCYDGVGLFLFAITTNNGPVVHPLDNTWPNMEQHWKYVDKGKLKDFEKTLSQSHNVHHTHLIWTTLWTNPDLLGEKPAAKCLYSGRRIVYVTYKTELWHTILALFLNDIISMKCYCVRWTGDGSEGIFI